jgi:hypothetical protein
MWREKNNTIRRALLGGAALVLMAASLPAVGSPDLMRPWCRFLHFYEVTENSSTSFWERVLFSAVLADTVPERQRNCATPASDDLRIGI